MTKKGVGVGCGGRYVGLMAHRYTIPTVDCSVLMGALGGGLATKSEREVIDLPT